MRWAIIVSAYSFTLYSGSVFEPNDRYRIGCSDGFCFAYDGGRGIGGRIA